MAVANQVWPTIVNYCTGLNLNAILLLVDYTGIFWDCFPAPACKWPAPDF